jgi:hypothetical protein
MDQVPLVQSDGAADAGPDGETVRAGVRPAR